MAFAKSAVVVILALFMVTATASCNVRAPSQGITNTADDGPDQADLALETSQAPITFDFPVEILPPVLIFLMLLFYGTEFVTYVVPVILVIFLIGGAILVFKR